MKRVILYNIRSAHNVGSVFRTSDGAGVEKLYLIGPTPLPIDRFGRTQPEIQKTSLGASESVAWEHVGEAGDESRQACLALIARLQREGQLVAAVELTEQATSIYDFTVPENVTYLFGSETEGVPAEVIRACDAVIEIPMQGIKESLNVSVTAGIVLFHQNTQQNNPK